MASVFKPTYTRPIPKNSTPATLKGSPAVKFTDKRGKQHTRRLTADGKKMVCEQTRWWMRYNLPDGTEKRAKGFSDKAATEQEAAKRERNAQGVASGLLQIDPEQLAKPLLEHFEDYVEDMERLGRTKGSIEQVVRHTNRIIKECGFQTLSNIKPGPVTMWLKAYKSEGICNSTANYALTVFRGFLNWCVRQGRLADNPLKLIQLAKTTGKTFYRRSLTSEEAARLIQAPLTKTGRRQKKEQRRIIYMLAITTGLRRNELKLLEWRDIHIGSDERQPRIELRAETTKARRADTLPLRDDVAAELEIYRPENTKLADRLFDGIPKGTTFRQDLKQAGIPREDKSGRRVDFHALRYTFGTLLAKNGVMPKVAMELMRHADVNLTMRLYTDVTILNPRGAVNDLPSIVEPPKTEENKELRVAKVG